MTEQELQHFAWAVAQISLAMGFLGGFAYSFMCMVMDWLLEVLDRRDRQALRIRDARWRAQWNRAKREAREAGYTGRRAVAYAFNVMKSRREAIAEMQGL